MKVLVLGGTGLIGFHSVKELNRRGHEVTALARNKPVDGLLPQGVAILVADINQCSDDQIRKKLSGHESLVFALGADDRDLPSKPAYEYFHAANVSTTERLIRLGIECGVQQVVICGSYFTYFDRIFPQWNLARHHPYIRSRKRQSKVAFRTAGKRMNVCILEIPWVFGSVRGRRPLWFPLVTYLRGPLPALCPRGGTTMIGARQVAEMVGAAIEHNQRGTFPVGDENLTWRTLVERMLTLMHLQNKRIIHLPDIFAKLASCILQFQAWIRGKQFGLPPRRIIEFQLRETYISSEDLQTTKNALGNTFSQLTEAIQETIDEVCLQKKSLNVTTSIPQLEHVSAHRGNANYRDTHIIVDSSSFSGASLSISRPYKWLDRIDGGLRYDVDNVRSAFQLNQAEPATEIRI